MSGGNTLASDGAQHLPTFYLVSSCYLSACGRDRTATCLRDYHLCVPSTQVAPDTEWGLTSTCCVCCEGIRVVQMKGPSKESPSEGLCLSLHHFSIIVNGSIFFLRIKLDTKLFFKNMFPNLPFLLCLLVQPPYFSWILSDISILLSLFGEHFFFH